MKQEQILVRITGQDRPGLTASVMGILAKYDAQILDIGQADIHSTLSLGILIRMNETNSGQVMKELLFLQQVSRWLVDTMRSLTIVRYTICHVCILIHYLRCHEPIVPSTLISR
jgi:predicted amino acid-binding ACT domain protein